MHAIDFLRKPMEESTAPMVVLSGSERFLKQSVLGRLREAILGAGEDAETGFSSFAGDSARFSDVITELQTVSMFGESRLVFIENATDFVSDHRGRLEAYLDKPASRGVLVMDVNSWPKNTRLYKKCQKLGLNIDCSQLKLDDLIAWIRDSAGRVFGKRLSRGSAQLLTELVGNDLGLLDRELAKLAGFVGAREEINSDDVRSLVGGWRLETTWVMLGAIRDGQVPRALECLDKLLVAGEAPLKIFGGISFVYRKLAKATELARQGVPLSKALKDSGVFWKEIGASEAYLRRIGRPRAEQFYHLLATADQDMKGRSRLPERTILERLFIRLAHLDRSPLRIP